MVLNAIRPVLNYGKRIVNVIPEMAISPTSSEVVGNAFKGASGGVFNRMQASWNALENHVVTAKATQGGFLKRLAKSLRGVPSSIGTSITEATAGTTGLAKVAATGKGLLKGLGKNFPLLGSIAYFLFDAVPNMIGATKDKGIVAGAVEGGKSMTRLAAASAGAAIGSVIPGLGSLIGGLAGWILGEKIGTAVVGKGYNEKKAEEQEILAKAQMQQQPQLDVAA